MDKPWENEPNRKEWESHGLPCLILRVDGLGHLCGYVGVPVSHPAYGAEWACAHLNHSKLSKPWFGGRFHLERWTSKAWEAVGTP